MAEGRIAGAASFLLRAETGQFNADISEAERRWAATTARMSDDTLKLDAATAKLRRTLARYPADSEQVKRATLAYRREVEMLNTATVRSTASLQRTERELGRVSRGALAGSGVFRGLGRSLAFASTAFLGGTGLVYGLRSSLHAAEEHQVATRQLEAALKAAGLSFGQYGERIDETLRKQRLLSGFTENDTIKAFTLLVRNTKDVNEALRLNALAADVARGRNLSLNQASILVTKAAAGNVTSLKRLGIEIAKGTTATQALAILQQRFAGAARAYGDTAAGAQARFNQAIHETEVAIGTALLPTFTSLLNKASQWLGKSRNQERIQRDVNRAVHDGAEVLHVLGNALHGVQAVLVPVVKALGGFEKTAEVAFGLWVATRLRGIAAGLGLVKTEAFAAAAGMDALAASERAAATAGAAGAVGGFFARGGGGVAGRINQYGRSPQPVQTPGARGLGGLAGLAGFFFLRAFSVGESGEVGGQQIIWDEKRDQFYGVPVFNGKLQLANKAKISRAEAMKYDPAFVKQVDGYKSAKANPPGTGPVRSRPHSGSAAGIGVHTPPPPRRTSLLSTTLPQSLELALARAGVTTSQDDDLRALQAEETYLRKAIVQKGRSKKDLITLYNELSSVEGQIQGIRDEYTRKQKQRTDKARRERERAARERQREQAAEMRTMQHLMQPHREAPGAFSPGGDSPFSPAARTRRQRQAAAATAADFRKMTFDFLQTLHGFDSQYASNVMPMHTRLVEAVHSLRQIEHLVRSNVVRAPEGLYQRHALENSFQAT